MSLLCKITCQENVLVCSWDFVSGVAIKLFAPWNFNRGCQKNVKTSSKILLKLFSKVCKIRKVLIKDACNSSKDFLTSTPDAILHRFWISVDMTGNLVEIVVQIFFPDLNERFDWKKSSKLKKNVYKFSSPYNLTFDWNVKLLAHERRISVLSNAHVLASVLLRHVVNDQKVGVFRNWKNDRYQISFSTDISDIPTMAFFLLSFFQVIVGFGMPSAKHCIFTVCPMAASIFSLLMGLIDGDLTTYNLITFTNQIA